MRRTKILATLGPASAIPEVLDGMIAAGLDAVRLLIRDEHVRHRTDLVLDRRPKDVPDRESHAESVPVNAAVGATR